MVSQDSEDFLSNPFGVSLRNFCEEQILFLVVRLCWLMCHSNVKYCWRAVSKYQHTGVTHCSLGMLWGYQLKFAPHTGSLNRLKTNHKIVILFTAEKFIGFMGGQSKGNSWLMLTLLGFEHNPVNKIVAEVRFKPG